MEEELIHHKEYYTDGTLYKEYTIDISCTKKSEYKEWHPNGQLSKHCFFKNGKLSGRCRTYHANGVLKTLSFHKITGAGRSICTNEYKEWYETGQLKIRYAINHGIRDGLYQEWHPNGQMKIECHYKNCFLHGNFIEWDETGTIIRQEHHDCSEGIEHAAPPVFSY